MSYRDFGIFDIESYVGLDLSIRMLKKELFDGAKLREDIVPLVLELQNNTPGTKELATMFHLIIKIGVYSSLQTLSLLRTSNQRK